MAVAAGRIDDGERLLTDVSPSLVQRFSRFLAEARASLAMARGEFDRAHEALTGVEPSRVAPVGLYNLGPIEVALAQHRPDDARDVVNELLEAAVRLHLTWKVAPLAALGTAAEAQTATQCQVEGDADGLAISRKRAEDLVAASTRMSEEILAVAGQLPPSVIAWGAMADARLADVSGEPSPDLWVRAVEASQRGGFPLLVLQSRLEAAHAYLSVGDRSAAAEQLGETVDEAKALGVAHQAAAARSLAQRARLRLEDSPGTDQRSTSERLGLTDREVQVLRLAADGMTNREIGELLFLSPKTVSVHITNVLRKLDVSSRREAARLAKGLGIV
jgi:DNA-binding CsgD family transcriptional regulator